MMYSENTIILPKKAVKNNKPQVDGNLPVLPYKDIIIHQVDLLKFTFNLGADAHDIRKYQSAVS